jgi:hypothetical protein
MNITKIISEGVPYLDITNKISSLGLFDAIVNKEDDSDALFVHERQRWCRMLWLLIRSTFLLLLTPVPNRHLLEVPLFLAGVSLLVGFRVRRLHNAIEH